MLHKKYFLRILITLTAKYQQHFAFPVQPLSEYITLRRYNYLKREKIRKYRDTLGGHKRLKSERAFP